MKKARMWIAIDYDFDSSSLKEAADEEARVKDIIEHAVQGRPAVQSHASIMKERRGNTLVDDEKIKTYKMRTS